MTEEDVESYLRWMVRCNDDYRCGFLGPTVKRFGPVPECEVLVLVGLAERREMGPTKARGYFITADGRAAVSTAPQRFLECDATDPSEVLRDPSHLTISLNAS